MRKQKAESRKQKWFSSAFCFLLSALCFIATADARPRAVRTADVPPPYKPLYAYLDGQLRGLETYLTTRTIPQDHKLLFGGELLAANTNRGPALLAPEALPGVRVYLDAMQRLGIQLVTVGIGYPQIDPSYPRNAEYVAFYKNVADEVRKRGMKLSVELGVIFTGTPFADVNVDFSTLTLEQYRDGKRTMAQIIVREMAPDYLGLVAEPDTEAGLTGVQALNDPATYAGIVSYILQGLDRRSTLIGAGVGTWGRLEFVEEFVKLNIDYVDVHHYPIWTAQLQNLVVIAQMARAAGKRVTIDETWLYKAHFSESTSIAANEEIFRRDTFSFWTPLDQRFLRSISKLATVERFDYIAPFWTNYYFGNVDYTAETATLSYREVAERVNRKAVENILAGRVTPLGNEYRQLIRE